MQNQQPQDTCNLVKNLDEALYKLIPESLSGYMKQILMQQEKSIRFSSLDEFQKYAEKLSSKDIVELHQGLVFFRKFMSSGDLSASNEILVQQLIDSGIVPKVFEVILQNKIHLLVYEALWIIFNVSTGSKKQVNILLQDDVIKQLHIFLQQSDQCLILEKVVLIFGNIAADGVKQRNQLVFSGVLGEIIKIKDSFQIVSNSYSKIAYGLYQLSYVKDVFKLLGEVICQSDETETLSTALYTLFNISESPEKNYAQQIIDLKVIPKLIKLLSHDELSQYSMKICGLVASGNDEQLDYLFKFELLSGLVKLLNHKSSKTVLETLWVLSNIAGGNKLQVKQIVQNELILDKLFKLVSTSKDQSVVYEAIIVLCNALSCSDNEDAQHLIQKGFLKLLISKLGTQDIKLLIKTLEGIFNILQKGEVNCKSDEDVNPYIKELEDLKGLDKIEQLQMHQDKVVYEKAYKILETFYESA